MKKHSFYTQGETNRIREQLLYLLTHSELRKLYPFTRLLQVLLVVILNLPTDWQKVFGNIRYYRVQGIRISFVDICLCCFRYGCTIEEYFVFRYFRRKPSDRASWITESIRRCVDKQFNIPHYHLMRDKHLFAQTFAAYMGREVISLGRGSDFAGIAKWCESQQRIVVKPRYGAEGTGVELLDYGKAPEPTLEYLKRLADKGEFVLESVLAQHSEMAKFNPGSVNSIRMITIESKGSFEIIGAFFRMGNGGVIDNFSAGGMVAPVDLETGKVVAGAITMDPTDERIVSIHPLTQEAIIGHQIPCWDEAIGMVKHLCVEVGGDKSIGWDIAICPDGPVLIEANCTWGTFMLQLTRDRGMLEKLLPYIDHSYLFPAHRKRFGLRA